MKKSKVPVVEKIMNANDQIAEANRKKFNESKTFAINIMASPGAGKTTFILKTIEKLASKYQIGVIEGDTAPVTIDADKITAAGMPAVQINTGGECHLDAVMMDQGMSTLNLNELDLVIVENVGNLICPASWDLGTHANIVISSTPEGDDKPYKYPNIYRGLDVLIISKTDLMPYLEFNREYFQEGVEMLNPGLITFPVSSKTGEGFTEWISWIEDKIIKAKK
ncbi:MAG: hydrogenase nickel incorporation protein HypB [Anaerolineaceae bacterium]|nr:hydrogenase nickel incorporation protein HypB [Anaerolineaceae bacterium]